MRQAQTCHSRRGEAQSMQAAMAPACKPAIQPRRDTYPETPSAFQAGLCGMCLGAPLNSHCGIPSILHQHDINMEDYRAM